MSQIPLKKGICYKGKTTFGLWNPFIPTSSLLNYNFLRLSYNSLTKKTLCWFNFPGKKNFFIFHLLLKSEAKLFRSSENFFPSLYHLIFRLFRPINLFMNSPCLPHFPHSRSCFVFSSSSKEDFNPPSFSLFDSSALRPRGKKRFEDKMLLKFFEEV